MLQVAIDFFFLTIFMAGRKPHHLCLTHQMCKSWSVCVLCFGIYFLLSFLNHVRTFSTWGCAGSLCVFEVFSEIVAELPPTSMLEEPHIIDTFLLCCDVYIKGTSALNGF